MASFPDIFISLTVFFQGLSTLLNFDDDFQLLQQASVSLVSTCYTPLKYQGRGFCLVPRRLSLAVKVVGPLWKKGKRKEQSHLASLLSPSRGPSRARPQFLVFRARLLLATEIEAPEEEAAAVWLGG